MYNIYIYCSNLFYHYRRNRKTQYRHIQTHIYIYTCLCIYVHSCIYIYILKQSLKHVGPRATRSDAFTLSGIQRPQLRRGQAEVELEGVEDILHCRGFNGAQLLCARHLICTYIQIGIYKLDMLTLHAKTQRARERERRGRERERER